MTTRMGDPGEKRKLLLVTHSGVDWDALVGEGGWLILHNIPQMNDPNFSLIFEFVPPGARVSQATLDRIRPDVVVHLDTGRIHNKETHDLDHHPKDEKTRPEFDSTAAILQADYPDEIAAYPWLNDLFYVTNLVDTGKLIMHQDPKTEEFKRSLNDGLLETGERELRVVDGLEEIRFMVNIFTNMPGSDYEKIRAGLNMLFAWHESKRPKTERMELVDQAQVESSNGVTFGILRPTDISCDKIRTYLRNHREYPWDVFLHYNTETRRVGITCLRQWVYRYMDRLFEVLHRKYPYLKLSEELFLHSNRFVIYLPLPQEAYPTVVKLAMETIGVTP